MTTFCDVVKAACRASGDPLPNTDPDTGIAYGTLDGNDFPYLLDDIISCGDDLTFSAMREDVRDQVRAAIVGVLDDFHYSAEKLVTDEDADAVLESAENAGLWDMSDSDEHEYAYESDGVHMLLSWLGGAPLIYVTRSPHTRRAAYCSPCVPCAGDLNTPLGDDTTSGVLCYDIPAEWYTGEDTV